MKSGHVDIITMGCSKNLVDSESLMRQFEAAGYHCAHDPKRPQGEIAVINTCGFIEDAKQESIDTILEFAKAKEEGRLKKMSIILNDTIVRKGYGYGYGENRESQK